MESIEPPPGGDVDMANLVLSVTWSFTTVSLIFVMLRLYSRVKHLNRLWWDDLFIVLGEILTIAFAIVTTVYVSAGGSRHTYYLSNSQVLQTLKLNYIFQAFVIMALPCCKVSIAFLILRLQAPGKLRTGLLVFLASSHWLWSVLDLIFLFVQCNPPEALYNPSIDAKCWRSTFANFTLALASYNAFLDLAYAAIAVSIVWQLQLSLQRRINLSLLLGVGVVAAVCSIIKTTKLPALAAEADYTWNTLPVIIWVTIEDNVIIMAACVPALRPLYLVLMRRPGAEKYTKRKGYHLHSLDTHHTHELQTTTQQTLNQPEPLIVRGEKRNSDVPDTGIRRTFDVDVSFEQVLASSFDFGTGDDERGKAEGIERVTRATMMACER